jgi:hypothetical protein
LPPGGDPAYGVDVKFRRLPWFFALLAVLLNLGSPMAWAQMEQPEATVECQGHAIEAEPAADTDSMPCCEDGNCHCVAPALSLSAAMAPAAPPHSSFLTPADTSTLPAHPLDDDLRPPIR